MLGLMDVVGGRLGLMDGARVVGDRLGRFDGASVELN